MHVVLDEYIGVPTLMKYPCSLQNTLGHVYVDSETETPINIGMM
jgi:hypothetical protein